MICGNRYKDKCENQEEVAMNDSWQIIMQRSDANIYLKDNINGTNKKIQIK